MRQLSNVEIGRLRALAVLLDTVPAERFGLESWASRTVGSECGFAGCAVGWAAHSGIFPGLRFDTEIKFGAVPSYADMAYKDRRWVWIGWEAVVALFGINQHVAEFLFHLDFYYKHPLGPTPRVVARRLRRFADKVEGRLKPKKVIKLSHAA